MTNIVKRTDDGGVAGQVAGALQRLVAAVPATDEPTAGDPRQRALAIAARAQAQAAAISGAAALPPGPAGLLTIVPELLAVWRVQAQMVADIAGTYGRTHALTREQMVYCLFRHAAAQAVRDLAVRAGERVLIRQASLHVLQGVLGRVGANVTQRMVGKGISRYLPVVGLVGVAAYAWYDTRQVAQTSIELFESDLQVEPGPAPSADPGQ